MITRAFSVITPTSRCNEQRFSSSGTEIPLRQSCIGCGSTLQTVNPAFDGYIPMTSIGKFNDGWRRYLVGVRGRMMLEVPSSTESHSEQVLRQRVIRVYCQRCFRLQQYGRQESPTDLMRTSLMRTRDTGIDQLISRIPRRSLVVHIIDVLNFEDSLLPEMYEKLHRIDTDVISVLNKIDCLPLNFELDERMILKWATGFAKVLRRNIGPDGKLNLVAVSSASGDGMDSLESRMAQYFSKNDKKQLFIVGSVNSGKSTFCNRFLKHIGYQHLGHVQYQRGIGGVTRSPIPGTTLNHVSFRLSENISLFDTPGISATGSMLSHMSCPDDFRSLCSGAKLQPAVLTLKEDKELLLGAMARIRLESGNSAQISSFVSPKVTLHLCRASTAAEFLRRKAGTFLYPPFSQTSKIDMDTNRKNHPILLDEWKTHRIRVFCGPSRSHDDIVISGLGWFSLYGHGHKIVKVTVPAGVRVFRRPSILPNFIQQHGSCKFAFRSRGRSIRVSRYKRMVARKNRRCSLKETWREETRQDEAVHRPVREGTPCYDLLSQESRHSYIVS